MSNSDLSRFGGPRGAKRTRTQMLQTLESDGIAAILTASRAARDVYNVGKGVALPVLAIGGAVLKRKALMQTLRVEVPELIEGTLEAGAMLTAVSHVTTIHGGAIPSLAAEIEAPPPTVPFIPSAPTANFLTPTSMTIDWIPPASDGGSPITGYNLYTDNGSGGLVDFLAVGPTAALTHTALGLTPDTEYKWEVTAVNAVGESARSFTLLVSTLPTPTVPGTPAAPTYGVINDTSIEVSWVSPLDDGGSPIHTYKIYSDNGLGGPPVVLIATLVVPPHGFTYVHTPLSHSTTYTYGIVAVNAIGDSNISLSSSASTTTPALPPLMISFNTDAHDIFAANVNAAINAQELVDIMEPFDRTKTTSIHGYLSATEGMTEEAISAFEYCNPLVNSVKNWVRADTSSSVADVFPSNVIINKPGLYGPPTNVKWFPRLFLPSKADFTNKVPVDILMAALDKAMLRIAHKNRSSRSRSVRDILDQLYTFSGNVWGDTALQLRNKWRDRAYGTDGTMDNTPTGAASVAYLGLTTTPAITFNNVGTGGKVTLGEQTLYPHFDADFKGAGVTDRAEQPSDGMSVDIDQYTLYPQRGHAQYNDDAWGADQAAYVIRASTHKLATPPASIGAVLNYTFQMDLPPLHSSHRTMLWFLDAYFACYSCFALLRANPHASTNLTVTGVWKDFFDTYLGVDSHWEQLLGRGSMTETFPFTHVGPTDVITPGGMGWWTAPVDWLGTNTPQLRRTAFGPTSVNSGMNLDWQVSVSNPLWGRVIDTSMPYACYFMRDGSTSIAELPPIASVPGLNLGDHPSLFGAGAWVVGLPFWGSCDATWYPRVKLAIQAAFSAYNGAAPAWDLSFVDLFEDLYPACTEGAHPDNDHPGNDEYNDRNNLLVAYLLAGVGTPGHDYLSPLNRFTACATVAGELTLKPSTAAVDPVDLEDLAFIQLVTTEWSHGPRA